MLHCSDPSLRLKELLSQPLSASGEQYCQITFSCHLTQSHSPIPRASQVVLVLGKEPTCQCRGCKRCRFYPCFGNIPWRRAWQSTPLLLPGESHGQRSLAGYSPWDLKESCMTKATYHTRQPTLPWAELKSQ